VKILKLTAENVKRLRAVEIAPDPDGNLVIVSGKNDQGKTSVLDSIVYALGGKRTIPSRPIREGETRAEVVLELDTLTVTRTWTSNDKSYLKVSPRGQDATLNNPQKILDELVGRLSFDPLEFARMDPRKRRATLLELADIPLDLDEIAQQRQQAEIARRDAGRDLKKLEAQLESMEPPAPDAPLQEESVAELTQALIDAERDARRKKELQATIADLEKRLAEAREELANLEDAGDSLDPEEIRRRIAEAEERNRQARQAAAYRELQTQVEQKRAERQQYQEQIEELDRKKAEALAAAKLPVDGLGVTDDEVTYQGIPFDQLSSSQQLRVSLAMAMALNPTLRVIRIIDGSLLDSDSMQVIEQMARERDFQIWMEVVDESGELGVVIEDGQVKAEGGDR